MLSFATALALGPMGVVSPLGSLGVAVPVSVGLIVGERPGLLQFAGVAVAVVGIVLAGGPELRGVLGERLRTVQAAGPVWLGWERCCSPPDRRRTRARRVRRIRPDPAP